MYTLITTILAIVVCVGITIFTINTIDLLINGNDDDDDDDDA